MKKKSIVIIAILVGIAILSFIIPIRKEEQWRVISNGNPSGFFGQGTTTSEKYKIYYNIFGIPIIQKATGETQSIW